MSSQNQATSETAPLLGGSRLAGQSASRTLPKDRFRFSPEVLLIPVSLATQLAPLMSETTVFELARQAVCRFWDVSHGDPTTLPGNNSNPSKICDTPAMEQYFATVIAIMGTIEGILVMAGCGLAIRISSRYGRKPAFLLILIVGIMGYCLILGSQYTPDRLAGWVFLVGMLFRLFSGPSLSTYLASMYIVDVCVPEDRTAALSKITGWAALGACISLALGGSITTRTGNPLIVFYISAAILVTTFFYVVFVLPESFPAEKRDALSLIRAEPSIEAFSTTPLIIFEPLKMLIPTRRSDGTRNWRLAWCAIHVFLFMAANSYIMIAWLVLVTSKYHLTPADTGLFLTIVAVSAVVVLTLILPTLVRFLRPYYSRKRTTRPLLAAEEDASGGNESELGTSDRLDVHLSVAACVIVAISCLSAAASTTIPTLVFSGIFIGFSYIHTPTTRSLVAGSVDPLKQGEALAAIEMVMNAGRTLSPILMGSILTATINTTPLLLFYVHMIVVLSSCTLLFLVRDADRVKGI